MPSIHPIEDNHPALDAAIETMSSDGGDVRDIAHELISVGLGYLRANCCDAHCLEELRFVHGWVGEKIAELQRGRH
jgi:hypothetical protein